jgi:hypothetical protein
MMSHLETAFNIILGVLALALAIGVVMVVLGIGLEIMGFKEIGVPFGEDCSDYYNSDADCR